MRSRTSTRSASSSRPTRPRWWRRSSGSRRSRSSSSRTRSPTPTVRRSTCRPVSTWGVRDRWPTGSPRCSWCSPATSTVRAGTTSPARAFPISPAPVDRSAASFVPTKWGPYRPTVGMMPAALLADLITDDDEPIRALVVIAGNPALSVGGSERLQEALASLELLVSIDLYRNATGELADFVLPATDQFEREDINTFVQGVQREPYVQWTGPVTEPDADQREEWRVLAELLDLDGLPGDARPGVRGSAHAGVRRRARGAGPQHRHAPRRWRRRAPRVGARRQPRANSVSPRRSTACPTACAARCSAGTTCSRDLQAEPDGQLKLITRRTAHMINSALQNVEKLKARGAGSNPLWMHPADARAARPRGRRRRRGAQRPRSRPRRGQPRRQAASRRRRHDPRLRQRGDVGHAERAAPSRA